MGFGIDMSRAKDIHKKNIRDARAPKLTELDIEYQRATETSADTLPEESEPLTLTINSKGEVFIQETKIEFNNLIKKILAVSNNRTDTRIYVRGDKTINYGRVLEVMGILSGSGFTKVALISEPYKER